jgi:hypothetical protein
MQIQQIFPESPSSIWSPKELPLCPPMPLDTPWVKAMQQFFPNHNPDVLAQHAGHLLSNTMRMISSQIKRDTERARKAAERMKDAIYGRS